MNKLKVVFVMLSCLFTQILIAQETKGGIESEHPAIGAAEKARQERATASDKPSVGEKAWKDAANDCAKGALSAGIGAIGIGVKDVRAVGLAAAGGCLSQMAQGAWERTSQSSNSKCTTTEPLKKFHRIPNK